MYIKKLNLIVDISASLSLKMINLNYVDETYLSWMNDYEVQKYTEQKGLKHSLNSITDFVNEKLESKNDYLFGIFSNDLHIGNIKLGPINWRHKTAQISYFIGNRDYWGQGIATLCISTVCKFASEELGLKKINGGVYSVNYPSQKVLEKCDFVKEGVRKKQKIYNGERVDEILFSWFKT